MKVVLFSKKYDMKHLALFKLPFEESIFSWQTKENWFKSRCYLRIYWLSFDKAVVIVRDLSDKPGLAIIDGGEELITSVCSHFKLHLSKIMWLEHFPAENPEELDIYYGVQLTSNQMIRYKLTQNYVERLLSTE